MTEHSHPTAVLIATVAATVLLAAFGTAPASAKITPDANSLARLRSGVDVALRADNAVSVRVLRTDRVPRSASRSMRGPALAALKASASTRLRRGLRVRMLHDRYRIPTVTISRGHAAATALVDSDQTVLPTFMDGDPRGRPLHLNEQGQFFLRRLPGTDRFVVWSVTLR